MADVVPKPADPIVRYPFFLVHQNGDPVVLNAGYVNSVASVNAESAHHFSWAKSEVRCAGVTHIAEESIDDICQLMQQPSWRDEMKELKRIVKDLLPPEPTQNI
jgi:hypothetical protein